MLCQLKLFILSIILISIFIFANASFRKTPISDYGRLQKGIESANLSKSLDKSEAEITKIVGATQNDDGKYAIVAYVSVDGEIRECCILANETSLNHFIIECAKCEPDPCTCG